MPPAPLRQLCDVPVRECDVRDPVFELEFERAGVWSVCCGDHVCADLQERESEAAHDPVCPCDRVQPEPCDLRDVPVRECDVRDPVLFHDVLRLSTSSSFETVEASLQTPCDLVCPCDRVQPEPCDLRDVPVREYDVRDPVLFHDVLRLSTSSSFETVEASLQTPPALAACYLPTPFAFEFECAVVWPVCCGAARDPVSICDCVQPYDWRDLPVRECDIRDPAFFHDVPCLSFQLAHRSASRESISIYLKHHHLEIPIPTQTPIKNPTPTTSESNQPLISFVLLLILAMVTVGCNVGESHSRDDDECVEDPTTPTFPSQGILQRLLNVFTPARLQEPPVSFKGSHPDEILVPQYEYPPSTFPRPDGSLPQDQQQPQGSPTPSTSEGTSQQYPLHVEEQFSATSTNQSSSPIQPRELHSIKARHLSLTSKSHLQLNHRRSSSGPFFFHGVTGP